MFVGKTIFQLNYIRGDNYFMKKNNTKCVVKKQ